MLKSWTVLARRRVLLAASLVALLLAPAAPRGAEYSLAIVPQFEKRKLFESWRPIASELERRTGHRIRLITTLGVVEFEAEYLRGTYDLVYMNPYFIAKTLKTIGYVPLVRDAVPVSGILIVRKGGDVRTPRDLDGKPVAFPTPNAVGASMVMRAELKQRFGVEVAPVYVRSVSNVALHVAKGLTDAGGVPEKGFPLVEEAVRGRLEIIHRTQPAMAHAIAAHPRVPAEVREAVRRAFLDLAATEEGKALLARIPMRTPIAATVEDYAGIARMGLDAWYEPGFREE